MNYFLLHAILSTIVGSGLFFVWYDLLFPHRFPVDQKQKRGWSSDQKLFYGKIIASVYILSVAYDYLFVKTAIFFPYLFGGIVWANFAILFFLTMMFVDMPTREKHIHLGFSLALFALFAIMTQLVRVHA